MNAAAAAAAADDDDDYLLSWRWQANWTKRGWSPRYVQLPWTDIASPAPVGEQKVTVGPVNSSWLSASPLM